jgi:hypothetical protein
MFATPYTSYVRDEIRRNRTLHYGLAKSFPPPNSPGYKGKEGMKRLAILMGYKAPANLQTGAPITSLADKMVKRAAKALKGKKKQKGYSPRGCPRTGR